MNVVGALINIGMKWLGIRCALAFKALFLFCVVCVLTVTVHAQEESGPELDLDGSEMAGGGENASNPLAKANNTDIRWQHFDLDGAEINDFFIDGAFMAGDSLKVKYELHYWETDITGSSEKGFESLVLKGIYFPAEGIRGNIKYRVAVGLDWIMDLGDRDKGIGFDSDQLGPFAGLALGLQGGTMLIPLVQQFISYSGEDVNMTAFRLIALKPLPTQMWLKLDAKIPVDWETDNEIPASAELQIGKTFTKNIGAYVDGLVGIGGDRVYDWGVGAGVRIKY
jgi:hypothetical protein